MSNINQPVTDWGNTIYSGLGGIGMFRAIVSSIVVTIIGFVFIVVGLYMIMNDDSNSYARIQGTVVQPNCVKEFTSYDKNKRPIDSYKCEITVTYKVNEVTYTNKMYLTGSSAYINGEPIDLMVRKDDPNNIQLGHINKASIGCIMVICALIIVGIVYLNYYLTYKYQLFAASQGASTIVDLFR